MIRSKTETRGLNKSKNSQKQLPRLNSQKRVQTAFQKRQNGEPLRIRPQSTNRQLKRTMSTSNACKTVRYQTTSAHYASKIKQLEKNNLIIDNEMKKVQEQINSIRRATMQTKRKEQFIQQGEKTQQQNKQQKAQKSMISDTHTNQLKYRKNININDSRTLKNEIKIIQNKIGITRKKIDQQVQKNNNTRHKIDNIRKDIKTYKNLNMTLLSTHEKTNQQFNYALETAKKLQEEITQKNILMNRIRVENLHRKGQIIKQYDNILKHLDKQLANNNKKSRTKTDNSQSNAFYMTEITQNHKKPVKKHLLSPKKRQSVLQNQLTTVQQNLQYLQNQFDYLKQQKGTDNADQLTKQFQNHYEQNFSYYKYINSQLVKNLQQAHNQLQQAKKQRDIVIEEINSNDSHVKIQEIQQIEANLQFVRTQKNKVSQTYEEYKQFYQQIKSLIKQIVSRINMKQHRQQYIKEDAYNEQNLLKLLQLIKQRFYNLKQYDDDEHSYIQNFQYTQDMDLECILQNAKNQTSNDKLMDRTDFLKMRQTIITHTGTTNNSIKRNKSNTRQTFLKK